MRAAPQPKFPQARVHIYCGDYGILSTDLKHGSLNITSTNNSWMSLPLKRKRESSPTSTGAVACHSNNLDRGVHTRRGRENSRGRDRGRGRGRSFHIPKGASQTALLTEVWKHRTHSTYAPSSQSRLVPRSPPISPQIESPSHHQPQPGSIAVTPERLHDQTKTIRPHNPNDFANFSEHQNAQSIHPRTVRRPNGPLRQVHRDKRRNQASTWMEQMIPLLLEPFMELLRLTKSGRVSVSPPAPIDRACSCSPVALKITCVSWDR